MKTFAAYLAAALAVVAIIIYADNRQQLQHNVNRVADAGANALIALMYALVVLFVLIVGITLAVIYREKTGRFDKARQRDGSFALRNYRIKGGGEIVVNPNNMLSSAGLFHPEHGWIEFEPAAGWDRQTIIRQAVELTHHLQAMHPGDETAFSRHLTQPLPVPKSMPKPSGPMHSHVTAPAELTNNQPPIQMLTNRDLISRNTATSFHLGQNEQTGEVAIWDVTNQPHARAHGASGKGKSTFAQNVILSALLAHWRVIILDRKGFKDYHQFTHHAELCNATQPAALIAQLHVIAEEQSRRDSLLAQHQAAHIDMLKANLRPTRTLVVIEEYNIQQTNAKANGHLHHLLQPLRAIALEGRSVGIHLFIVDQHPDGWDASIKANVDAIFTFHLPEHSGRGAGYTAAHTLPTHHFAFNGVVYKPMYVNPQAIPEGLERSRPNTPPPLIPADLRSGRTSAGDIAAAADSIEDDPLTDKQAAAFAWMDQHRPEGGTQAEMRRALSLSKGYASELWAQWTPSAAPATSTDTTRATATTTDAYGRPLDTIDADDPDNADTLAAIRAAIESGEATINRRK